MQDVQNVLALRVQEIEQHRSFLIHPSMILRPGQREGDNGPGTAGP